MRCWSALDKLSFEHLPLKSIRETLEADITRQYSVWRDMASIHRAAMRTITGMDHINTIKNRTTTTIRQTSDRKKLSGSGGFGCAFSVSRASAGPVTSHDNSPEADSEVRVTRQRNTSKRPFSSFYCWRSSVMAISGQPSSGE
jgi:hypothetical protein